MRIPPTRVAAKRRTCVRLVAYKFRQKGGLLTQRGRKMTMRARRLQSKNPRTPPSEHSTTALTHSVTSKMSKRIRKEDEAVEQTPESEQIWLPPFFESAMFLIAVTLNIMLRWCVSIGPYSGNISLFSAYDHCLHAICELCC